MEDKDIGAEGMTTDSVEEWLEEIAETEGLSREETLEDLVSSYWRLEEIFHLLQDTDIDLDRSPESPAKRDVATERDLEELRSQVNRIAQKLEESEANAASIAELQGAVNNLDSRLEQSEDQLSEVSGELSELLDGPLAEPDELVDQLTTLERRMNRVESQVSQIDDQLEDLVDSAVTHDQFDAYVQEVSSTQEVLRNEHRSLKELVRNEFGNIRTILTHLLETSGGSKEPNRQASQKFENDVRDHLEEEATVASILRVANREGIRTASCDHCGHTVDLSLLESPVCPNCERVFENLESSPRFLGIRWRNVLTLANDSSQESE